MAAHGTALTDAQLAWMREHPKYTTVGWPRPGVYFTETGTLYEDGTFEPCVPMKPIVLRRGCVGVGIPQSVKSPVPPDHS